MVTSRHAAHTEVPAPVASAWPGPAEAEQLLAAMAAFRRTTRRTEGRPGFLSTLTDAQVELVKLVGHRPGLSVAEAAERLHLAPNTVSTLVGQLTAAGVMVRMHDAGDRRVAQLHLDAATGRRFADWRDRRAEVVAKAMASMAPRDWRRLREATPALERLADAISVAREA